MSIYVVGDIHGCYDELMALLKKIKFGCSDTLIFVGDLVNRGPKSLEVLRFIKSLKSRAKIVLGNHDFHLISVSLGLMPENQHGKPRFVLGSYEKYELVEWLCQQNLLITEGKFIIVHAGIAPMWSLGEAKQYAAEVEAVLKEKKKRTALLRNLFNDSPSSRWDKSLMNIDRLCCIVNYFTRIRVCDYEGTINFDFIGSIKNIPNGCSPWFAIPNPNLNLNYTVIFGHWAALNGKSNSQRHIALDTGCVWGGKLSAYCITTRQYYQVNGYSG